MVAEAAGPGRPAYLTHLDGLRAAALLGVLLFHFKLPGAGGGFVGVDVFLVLSGFLYAEATLFRAVCFCFLLSPESMLTSGSARLACICVVPG